MVSKRKTPSQANNESRAIERERINVERANVSPTGITTAMLRRPPAPAPVPGIRQEFTGNAGEVLTGEVVRVPDWADRITIRLFGATGPAQVSAQACRDERYQWGTPRMVELHQGDATVWRYDRPPSPMPYKTGPQPSDPLKVPDIIPTSEPPGPRHPGFVRVVITPRQRKGTYSATAVIEFVKGSQ